LRVYPLELRDEYGDEMARCFRDLCRDALEHRGGLGVAGLWARTLPELLATALKERSSMVDRQAYRSVAGVALATAFLLVVPFFARWAWDLFDFVFAGAIIFGTGLTYVLVLRKAGNMAYRVAVGIALAAVFMLVWINLAVGVIGSEDNPANLMYGGVLAIGFFGALVARFRPQGMARALIATALAQALVPVIALMIWKPQLSSGVLAVLGVNAIFVMLFVGSAVLFRSAARDLTPAGAGSEG
jgi:hypothetical protein